MASGQVAAPVGDELPTYRPFTKVLIANRGEIAVRIEQTCREIGLRTVAVYSECDASARHVREADEAVLIGPPPPLESYLSIDAILRAARETGAEAIHPGYGFLAENPDFASAVRGAGMVWIGPPAEVIAQLGDKVAAKRLAGTAGVPVVPGYDGADQRVSTMRAEAERIGYPLMVKAVAGGGGKGMRVVHESGELPEAVEAAQREAKSAFGDERVFLEKLIERPRHIEIQVLADAYGAAVYLGERDCSMQRRHQKVIEEAPSPVMTPELRRAMGEAALRLVRAAQYVNAGTVEFLFDSDRFYFLEVNTRIQVEHPVTEMVTGLDLVRLQLDVAAGHRLALSQLDVDLRGHAIEARVYAENPGERFLPSTGTLIAFDVPFGPGIRNDSGVQTGAEITPYYDPMLAKLVVHAGTRAEAVARLRRALDNYAAIGVVSNLDFLKWIAKSEEFTAGNFDVDFIDRCWQPRVEPAPDAVVLAAALYSVLTPEAAESGREDRFSPWAVSGAWRPFGLRTGVSFRDGDRVVSVELDRPASGDWVVRLDGQDHRVHAEVTGPNVLVLREGDRTQSFVVGRAGNDCWVAFEGTTYRLQEPEGATVAARRSAGANAAGASSPMPGTVVKVIVQEGQHVTAREPLVVLEAMKMEHVVEAPYSGTVGSIHCREGDMVPAGIPLVQIRED